MKRVNATDLKTCKMSELAGIAKSVTVGLIHNWDKGMETALVEQVSHIRYSFNPKKIMDKHSILYSGESVAMSPNRAINDKDEIIYAVLTNAI